MVKMRPCQGCDPGSTPGSRINKKVYKIQILANIMASKSDSVKVLLDKLQEKEKDAEPYESADLNKDEVEKIAQDIKKYLAEKSR